MTVAPANLVSINGPGSCARSRADGRALLASGDGADARARSSRSRHRQLIFVFLPERALVTTMTSGLRGCARHRERQSYKHQKNDEKPFHPSHTAPLYRTKNCFESLSSMIRAPDIVGKIRSPFGSLLLSLFSPIIQHRAR